MILDLTGLVKVFRIVALTESLVLSLRGSLRSKTIFCHKVALNAQLMNVLI